MNIIGIRNMKEKNTITFIHINRQRLEEKVMLKPINDKTERAEKAGIAMAGNEAPKEARKP